MTHVKSWLKKIGPAYSLQKHVLKKRNASWWSFEYTWENQKMTEKITNKMMFCLRLLVTKGTVKEWKWSQDLEWKAV